MRAEPSATIAVLLALLIGTEASADRGAVTIDAGGGGLTAFLPAPTPDGFLVSSNVTLTTAPLAWAGARYALSNTLEIALGGFYEPPVMVFHNGAIVTSPDGARLPGTLQHHYSGFGAAAGARWLWGDIWRLTVGGEAGWSRRFYGGLAHINDAAANPYDYRLDLHDFTVDSVTLSALGGIEWSFSDHMSVSVLARLQLLAGRELSFAATLPIVFSYGWYL
jgi:hypothetical protein